MITLDPKFTARTLRAKVLDFGHTNFPSSGGKGQRINRLGNRFEFQITLPPVRSHEEGEELIADLIEGKQQGLRMRVPLFGYDVGNWAHTSGALPAVRLNMNQASTSLSLKNLKPGYLIRKGQYISVTHNGESYLHKIRQGDSVRSSGLASVKVSPRPRVLYSIDDPVEFEYPVIEGLLIGDSTDWQNRIGNLTDIIFIIREQ